MHLLAHALMIVVAAGVTLWTAGAIYYDVGDRTGFRRPLALAWVAAVVILFAVWQPVWQPFAVLLGVFGLFLAWWLSQKPRQDRDWSDLVTVLPAAAVDGDAVTIEGVWNHDYRSFTDYTPRLATRTYRLSNLIAADVLFFYWGSPWMSHPLLVFDFGPDGRVCFSIEVRYRKGQGYALLPSLYRQQEITVVVADEYDAIARRAKYGTDQGYLYRLTEPPDRLRPVFLDYIAAINHLRRTPEWYHGLCANCTTSFYRLPSTRRRCDWRVLVNGRLDRALYQSGQLDRSVPFDVLKRTAFLNEIVRAVPRDGFGDHVRAAIAAARAAETGRGG